MSYKVDELSRNPLQLMSDSLRENFFKIVKFNDRKIPQLKKELEKRSLGTSGVKYNHGYERPWK